ncbi:MAG: flagellar hook-associated protein FlgK [Cyanobacteria bacterium SIG32]|nr:flagellar hook-associated protein FlgK [Cyanobacteria bacterium SIG32]
MVSLFSSLNIASNALTVNESAISVVSHNVANMNTEGYSKQRVNLATRNISGAIGDNVQAQIRANGGVMIANVTRYNDAYLNSYYRDQLSILKEYEEKLGNIGDLADIFDDLEGTGISDALASFYEAVNNLNEYPASSTARVNFIESAKTLTATLNAKSVQLDELNAKALGDGKSLEALENSKIYNQFEVFNNKLEELAECNKALTITQTGTLEANNLLDRRDMILNEIAEFVDINIDEKPNGSVDLYVGGIAMVSGSVVTGELEIQTAEQYCLSQDPPIDYPNGWVTEDGKPRENAVLSIVNNSGETKQVVVSDANSIINSGALGGMLHSADLDADGMNVGIAQDKLNQISQAIADLFNTLNTREGAYHINPDNTNILSDANKVNIFNVDADGKTTAGTISVNEELLTEKGCWLLSCAYFDPNGDTFDERAIGNAQNVVAMLGTRSQNLDGQNGIPDLGGMTIEDAYTSLLGKIAASGSNGQALVDTQGNVVDSIYNQIKSNNSVDLNEELVDLVKYQTAYSAAAQVFNTCNACLDTLMSLGG